MLEAQNEHFVQEFLKFPHFVATKLAFAYEFSTRTPKSAASKLMFRARFPSIFNTCHKMRRLPWNLQALDAALKIRFAKNTQHNTQHNTSEVPRLPRKMRMKVSKVVLRLPRKMQLIFWKRPKSIVPVAHNDFWHLMKRVGMPQSAMPATRNEVT